MATRKAILMTVPALCKLCDDGGLHGNSWLLSSRREVRNIFDL